MGVQRTDRDFVHSTGSVKPPDTIEIQTGIIAFLQWTIPQLDKLSLENNFRTIGKSFQNLVKF